MENSYANAGDRTRTCTARRQPAPQACAIPLKFLSVFTGMCGFDLGLTRAGHQCVGQVENDSDCLRVLNHHYPEVPKVDDVNRFRAMVEPKYARRCKPFAVRPDLLCGGFPCQDLSVAGGRAGLAGSRSGLWFVFRRIIGLVRPRWVLIENVPGLLSSHKGRDMAAIVEALGQLGYGWAYRVLDSRYFGVPQRRRRVFIVGCLGDCRRAAAVLFESVSGEWNPEKGQEARQKSAACIATGINNSGLRSRQPGSAATFATVRSRSHSAGVNEPGRGGEDDENLIAYQCHGGSVGPIGHLRAGNGNEGGGVPFVMRALRASDGHHGHSSPRGDGADNLVVNPYRTLEKDGTVSEGFKEDSIVDALHDRTGNKEPLVISQAGSGKVGVEAHSLTQKKRADQGQPAIFQTRIGRNGRGQPSEVVHNLTSSEGGTHADSKPHVFMDRIVRRLTPLECLRLQGFPDDWLDLDPPLSDSAKYRMIGNAVTVPVIEWIGKRLLEAMR